MWASVRGQLPRPEGREAGRNTATRVQRADGTTPLWYKGTFNTFRNSFKK